MANAPIDDTSGRAGRSGAGIRGRYVNRLVVALGGAGVVVGVFAVVSYVTVIRGLPPGVRQEVLSNYVGLVLTAFVSLALVGITVGSNTAIALRLLSEKAKKMEQGDMNVELETSRNDEFGTLASSLASMRDALEERIEESEQRRRRTERLNEHMQAKAEHYEAVLQDVMEGDLSRRVDATSDNEALESIGTAINTTVAELENATDNIARQMDNLSANSEEMAAAADELAETSERAADTGSEGREAAESAIEEMERVEAGASGAVDEMEALRSDMREIEEITDVITEIARRTNILAVNARIESSRSESAGQGYSVVADEIRDLAEKAQEAAQDIGRRLQVLRNQTEDTAEGITATQERAETAAEAVQDATEAFDELVGYVEDVDVNAQNISQATDDQAESVGSVAGMVDNLSSMRTEYDEESVDTTEEMGFEKVRQD